jgi:ParB-like chromosome segregation protein Spo0J
MNPILDIKLSLLEVSKHNVRKTIDPSGQSIKDLSDNIKEYGLLSAIWVKPIPNTNRYEIFAGQRRFLACNLLGAKTMRCEVFSVDLNVPKMLEKSIIENVQREEMTISDKCRAYYELYQCRGGNLKGFKKCEKDKASLGEKLHPDLLPLLDIKGNTKLALGVAMSLIAYPMSQQKQVLEGMTKGQVVGGVKEKTAFLKEASKNLSREVVQEPAILDKVIKKTLKDQARDKEVASEARLQIEAENLRRQGIKSQVYDESSHKFLEIPEDKMKAIIALIKS